MLKKIIIGPGYPLRGGISESNESLSTCFKNMKEECQIISYSLQYPDFLFPGKTQKIDKFNLKRDNTIHLINTLNPLSWINTAQYIIQQKPDYVIIRYWHPYFAICLGFIARILKKKSIFIFAWIDNSEPHEFIPFQHILTSFFVNSCDKFIVMSQMVKNNLLNYKGITNENILVSPHPIYDTFGKSIDKYLAREKISSDNFIIDKNGRYILFFGLIRKYKGLDLLLDVMNSTRIKRLKIKLIVAGEFYDSKQKYMTKIKSLGLEKSILIHDYYVPNADVTNYFSAIDIVVQPYLSATQSGVSMVAYNFNKPILLTNVGGLSEYVNHQIDGYLVDVNKESIILALEDYYLNNRETSFINAIKRKKSFYSWEKLANLFNKSYEN